MKDPGIKVNFRICTGRGSKCSHRGPWTLTMEAWALKMGAGRVCRPEVADSHNFDPDPHLSIRTGIVLKWKEGSGFAVMWRGSANPKIHSDSRRLTRLSAFPHYYIFYFTLLYVVKEESNWLNILGRLAIFVVIVALLVHSKLMNVDNPVDTRYTDLTMDQISIKTSNPKCRLFLKFTSKGTWQQVFRYLSIWGPPPLLVFCLGWWINFVGSESGQIHSILLLYMVST